MPIRTAMIVLIALSLCSCSQSTDDASGSNQGGRPEDARPEVASIATNSAQPNASLPDDRTPLEEPSGPIDPKSAEGAGQVVQHYGALIEQGRWTESWKLWSDPGAAKAFDRNWRELSEIHMEIGKPGDMGGAAGSIYISEPVVFYGKTKAGASYRRGATVTMRRVNDVPGSTEEQRRWHIERIELKDGA